MADVLEEFRHFVAFRLALGRDLVADAPHHDTRVVAVLMEHVHHVPFSPFIEKAVVAVGAFGYVPFVERLYHHHEAHLVTKAHKFRSRHVVGCADGIAAHILQKVELMPKGGNIDGGAERAEVMMVADALELAALTVEIESLFRYELYGADAETGLVDILKAAAVINPCDGGVESRRLRGPQLRILHNQILHKRIAMNGLALE